MLDQLIGGHAVDGSVVMLAVVGHCRSDGLRNRGGPGGATGEQQGKDGHGQTHERLVAGPDSTGKLARSARHV